MCVCAPCWAVLWVCVVGVLCPSSVSMPSVTGMFWNAAPGLLTHAQRSHWLLTARVAVSGNSHILYMWKLSGASLFHSRLHAYTSAQRTWARVKLFPMLYHPVCFRLWFLFLLLLHCQQNARGLHVQVRSQSEIAKDGQGAAQVWTLSGSGCPLRIKGEHLLFPYILVQELHRFARFTTQVALEWNRLSFLFCFLTFFFFYVDSCCGVFWTANADKWV